MKVTLEKHGGLAAGIRRQPISIDATSLDPHAKTELTHLVEAVANAGPPATAHDQLERIPDAMSYVITVEKEGDKQVFRQSDLKMHPTFADLLDWLEVHR
jgi:hypothetical protein